MVCLSSSGVCGQEQGRVRLGEVGMCWWSIRALACGGGGGGIKSHTCVLGSPRVLAVVEFQFWGDELLVLCRASVLVEHVEGVLPSPRAAYRFHCHTISPRPEKQKEPSCAERLAGAP